MENSILLKGLKMPNTKSSRIAGVSRMFFCIIYMSNHRTVVCELTSRVCPWVDGAESVGCKFGRYFYRSRCNCFCLTFCTNYKYERDRNLGERLGSDQFRGGNGPSQFVYFQSCFGNVHTIRSCDTF